MNVTTWAAFSDGLVYSAIAVYVAAMLAYAAETAGRVAGAATTIPASALVGAGSSTTTGSAPSGPVPSRGSRIGAAGTSLAVLGLGLNAAAVLARGLAAQRAPWGNMYEFMLVIALAAGTAYLVCLSRQPVRELGVWVVTVIVLALGLAITVLYAPVDDLVPVLNSYWLVVHVAAAIIAGGVFTLGAVSAALFLVRERGDRRRAAHHDDADGDPGRPRRRGYSATLPSAITLGRVSHTAHMFAFPLWTFAVIAGAIWAENSWGRYWGWDPKETWAFITWVLYAAYLHAQATVGWRGRKATWFALAGYLAFVFNFFGVNILLPGLHSYAGV